MYDIQDSADDGKPLVSHSRNRPEVECLGLAVPTSSSNLLELVCSGLEIDLQHRTYEEG
jgi:hypothetical protein